MPQWIWQHPAWPQFTWQAAQLAPVLRQATLAQGELLGKAKGADKLLQADFTLDAMLQNIIHSSSIEGEKLNAESVRSSLAWRLGLVQHVTRRERRSEGLAQIMFDATQNLNTLLDLPRLLQWHTWLFEPEEGQHPLLADVVHPGQLRGDATMQVISARIDAPTVHFQAPPRAGLEQQLSQFIDWFNQSSINSTLDYALDPMLRAAIAHFWFVTIHPFEDGNGRLTRALTDLALAQGEAQSIRLYAMPVAILADRNGYYQILEQSQRMPADGLAEGKLDLTPWLLWFVRTLHQSLLHALGQIDGVINQSRFWLQHRDHGLGPEQCQALNKMMEPGNFPDGINASQYQGIAKVSKATATRHLAYLQEKGCLLKSAGGGRSTRYQIRWPE
jgi:Fic family protein